MTLLILVLLPFAACILAAFLPSYARNRAAWFATLIGLAGVINVVLCHPVVSRGEVLRYNLSWLPEYGLDLQLRMDGLAWLFSLLIQGIFLLVVWYTRYYMSAKDPVPRFFAFLLGFMGAMQGVVLSGNLIQLVIFWELTSLMSFLLIGYWHHRNDARRGARMAFTVTAIGGLALLFGVLVLGHIVGSYQLDVVLASGDTLREHPWYLACLLLIVLGALPKSAQFPFHFWLPHAMAAPTPVSAYLHSATMVKAGVFLLLRLWPVLGGTIEWTVLVAGAGICTLLIAGYLAIFQQDMKGLLAYSTISHLGLITALIGIGSPLAIVAAIFHILNHATFKASLFMAVGIIDHESGSRDMRKLSGLWRLMPYTATLAMVASAAMAGVPLLNGFLSKEMFFAESLSWGSGWWMSVAAVTMGVFGVAYSLRFVQVFFGPAPTQTPKMPHEPPRWMRLPVELLALSCLIVGIFPQWTVGLLLNSAASSVLGEQMPDYSLALWHGINAPLLMSVLAFAGGILFFYYLKHKTRVFKRSRVPLLWRFNGKKSYESFMLSLSANAVRLERFFSTKRLQRQLFMMVLAGVLASLLVFRTINSMPLLLPDSMDDYLFGLLWLTGGLCAVVAAWQAKYHRLAALILIGGTGIVSSLTFLWLSAPDLALTQLMVETVTTILLLLGLRWLPPRISARKLKMQSTRREKLRRGRDFVLACSAGLVMALLSYVVLVHPPTPTISGFYLENALALGGGSNVVNVMLVDFRALDTLGEVTVLSIVALTVYALLRRFRPALESLKVPRQQQNPIDPATLQGPAEHANQGYLLIPGIYIRLLLPLIAMVSVYFFMRGHNLPGGGFIAGLILSVALILQYLLAGTLWVESRFKLRPHRWIGNGLALALLTGVGAWAFGYPFLTSHTAHLTLPWGGDMHLPSAFVFDLGVFCVVVGTTMLILIALAHQSVRSHRVPGTTEPSGQKKWEIR